MGILIIITGTPGVGKSTLAKKLAKELGFQHLDLHGHYKELSTGYNRKKQCYDLDFTKVQKFVSLKKKEGNFILDSHVGHLLPRRLVDVCVVLLCPDLKKLKKRLQDRKYTTQKIAENIQAEIFQVCLEESLERKQNVLVLETPSGAARKIRGMLRDL